MENRYIITIDLKKKTITNAKYKQNDAFTSIIEINMVDGVSPVDITGQIISFKFLRSDGSIAIQDINNGVTIINPLNGDFQCVLESNTLSIYGIVNCEISFSDGENILSTATFNFNVTQSIGALSVNYISSVANQIALWQAEVNNFLRTVGKGLTSARPTLNLQIGQLYLDTTLNVNGKPIYWNGTVWIDNTGGIV